MMDGEKHFSVAVLAVTIVPVGGIFLRLLLFSGRAKTVVFPHGTMFYVPAVLPTY